MHACWNVGHVQNLTRSKAAGKGGKRRMKRVVAPWHQSYGACDPRVSSACITWQLESTKADGLTWRYTKVGIHHICQPACTCCCLTPGAGKLAPIRAAMQRSLLHFAAPVEGSRPARCSHRSLTKDNGDTCLSSSQQVAASPVIVQSVACKQSNIDGSCIDTACHQTGNPYNCRASGTLHSQVQASFST